MSIGAVGMERTQEEFNGDPLEQLQNEISDNMYDWEEQMQSTLASGKLALLGGKLDEFDHIMERKLLLLDYKRHVERDKLRRESVNATTRTEVIQLLENRRHKTAGYIIPRNQRGDLASTHNTSILDLFRLHREMNRGSSNVDPRELVVNMVQQRKAKMMGGDLGDTMGRDNLIAKDSYFQLEMNIEVAMVSAGDPVEVHFSLYDIAAKQFTHENYVLMLTREGFPTEIKLLENMKAIFRDVHYSTVAQGLAIVARIYRRGVLSKGSKAKRREDLDVNYKRPYGCVVTKIEFPNGIAKQINRKFCPMVTPVYMCKEQEFHKLHELILEKSKEIHEVPKSRGIVSNLMLHDAEFGDMFKNEPMPEFMVVSNPTKTIGSTSPSDHRNDLYIKLDRGVFSHSSKCSIRISAFLLNQDGDIVPHSIGAGVNNMGTYSDMYESSIFHHDMHPCWNETFKVNIDPDHFDQCHLLFTVWDISSKVDKNTLVSFTFLPFMKNGKVLVDGPHKLSFFKPMKNMENLDFSNASYLEHADKLFPREKDQLFISKTLCSTSKTQVEALQSLFDWKSCSKEALLTILNNLLYVTGFEIIKLMKEVFDILSEIMTTYASSQSEIDEQISRKALHCFAFVLDQLTSGYAKFRPVVRRYIDEVSHFPQLHQAMLSTITRLATSAESLAVKPEKDRIKALQATMKMLKYIFRFIFSSWNRFRQDSGPEAESQFTASIVSLMSTLSSTLLILDDRPNDVLIGAKGFYLRSMPLLLEDIQLQIPPSSMEYILKDLIHFLSAAQSPRISLDKLRFLHCFCSTPVFQRTAVQDLLTPQIAGILQTYMAKIRDNSVDEVLLCVSIFSSVLKGINDQVLHATMPEKDPTIGLSPSNRRSGFSDQGSNGAQRTSHTRLSQLRTSSGVVVRTTSSYKEPSQISSGEHIDIGFMEGLQVSTDLTIFSGVLCELVHVVHVAQDQKLGRIDLPDAKAQVLSICDIALLDESFTLLSTALFLLDADTFLDVYSAIASSANSNTALGFVEELVQVYLRFISKQPLGIYADEWLTMRLFAADAVFGVITYLRDLLASKYLHSVQEMMFDSLWRSYLGLIVHFIEALESLGENRKSHQTDKASELTRSMCTSVLVDLEFVFSKLPDESAYVLGLELLEHHVVNLVLSRDSKGRDVALQIYDRLLQHEFKTNIYPSQVEKTTFELFYHIGLLNPAHTDQFTQALFSFMESRMQTLSPSHAYLASYSKLLDELKRVYRLMRTLIELPENELYENERINSTLDILDYLRVDPSHISMYRTYVWRLVQIHLSLENYVEAGLTLKMMTDTLSWSEEELEPFPDANWPVESASKRLFRIYYLMIQYFEKEDDFERIIDVYGRLKEYHENIEYDYERVSDMLHIQAEQYEHIVSSDRYYSSFFRVCFFGSLFGPELNNKEFIYKARRLEGIAEFSAQMKAKYPKAVIHSSFEAPSEEQLAKSPMLISIVSVQPCCSMEDVTDATQYAGMPKPIRQYKMHNNVSMFAYRLAVNRSKEKNPANEFKNLWIKKTFLMCGSSFPCYSRRQYIEKQDAVWISPIRNAILSVRAKSADLSEMVDHVRVSGDLGPLTMCLTGMIDAAVSGGTQKYIEAFILDPSSDIETADQVLLLEALQEQVQFLRLGLVAFEQLCPPNLKALLSHLMESFVSMKIKVQELRIE